MNTRHINYERDARLEFYGVDNSSPRKTLLSRAAIRNEQRAFVKSYDFSHASKTYAQHSQNPKVYKDNKSRQTHGLVHDAFWDAHSENA